jgi:hypothetical protein
MQTVSLARDPPKIPGVVADVRIQQSRASAGLQAVDVDRSRAQDRRPDDARRHQFSLVVNLAGSSQVAPTYWLNPANGVSYNDRHADAAVPDGFAGIAVSNLPIMAARAASQLQVLGGVADHQARHRQNAVVSAVRPAGHGADLCRGAGSATWVRSRPTCAARRRAELAPLQVAPQGSLGKGAARAGEARWNRAFSGLLFGLAGRDRADLPC